ncbi:MAG: hypothetical protein EXR79_07985 [Myxococcales bacterium]|nr:hypothetical protein [Myxococcales bacterium]
MTPLPVVRRFGPRRLASAWGSLAALCVSAPVAAQETPATTPAAGPLLQLEGDDPAPVPPTPTSTAPDRWRSGPNDNAGRAAQWQRTSLFANLTDKVALQPYRVTLGGYGEVEFVAERGADSQFVHHRYVLFVYGQLHPRISTATEFEIEFGGSPAKRAGVLGPGEAILEFSVVDFTLAPWLVLRGGIVLVPFGAYNLRHDSPTQDLTERPLALTTITPTTWFETGVGFHGTAEAGDHTFGYEVYAINGLDAKIDEAHGFKGAVGSKGEDNNDDKAIVGRVTWAPGLRFEVGASGYTGEYDDLGHRVNMAGLDATARLGWLEVQAEAVHAAVDPGYVEGFAAGSPANTRAAVPTGMWGGSLQANAHFTVPWLWELLPADLQDATCTGVVRLEATDPNTAATNGFDVQKVTVGLNFRPIENYVIKSELQFVSRSTDGRAHHVASGDWQPEPKFLGSMAFLF